jgi:diguanylate cyclase (GGDEF)-like protein/PAS domain S-box-containing protein
MPASTLWRRLVTQLFLIFVFVGVYLLLTRPEIILVSRLGYVAWYPAIGLAVALLLSISPQCAVLLGFADALAGLLNYHQPIKSYGETVGALGISICYGVATYILRGPWIIDWRLQRRRDVVRYVFICTSAAAVATIIGVACLLADRTIGWGEIYSAGLNWFLGDAIAVLGIAPCLLIHVFPLVRKLLSLSSCETERNLNKRWFSRGGEAIEALGQSLALLVALWVMFTPAANRVAVFYIGFIPILWTAIRHGIRGAVLSVLALNVGIVVAMHLNSTSAALLARTGAFMLVISATGLIVGAEVTERAQIATDLAGQTASLNSLIENSPFGIVVVGRQGELRVANPAFRKLLVTDKGTDLVPNDAVLALSDVVLRDSLQVLPNIFAGQQLQRTLRERRPDGSWVHLELQAVPLLREGRIDGAYLIYKDISERVEAAEAEQRNVQSLGELIKELQLRAGEMTLLNEMRDLLDGCTKPKDVHAVVRHSLEKLFPQASSGALYVIDQSRASAHLTASWGNSSEELIPLDACWALKLARTHWSTSEGGAIRCTHLRYNSSGSSLCAPLTAQSQALGVLHLEFAKDSTHPTMQVVSGSVQRLATGAAGQIAIALANLSLRETLREQSIRDPLTRLFNRRFMEESLTKELHRAQRYGHPLSVAVFDIDHFKRCNDICGHDAGDYVLRSIAGLLHGFFRPSDVCCRTGGEEFAIILPDCSSQMSILRANDLREKVRHLNLEHDGRQIGPVTISGGLATFPDHDPTGKELLKIADRCLYESKARGRNVVSAPTALVTTRL